MNQTDWTQPDDAKATFVIEVKYQENATWQGNVNWVEGHQTEGFRSTLELLRLMDSANHNTVFQKQPNA